MKTLDEALAVISTIKQKDATPAAIAQLKDTLLKYKEIANEAMNSTTVAATVFSIYLIPFIEIYKKSLPYSEENEKVFEEIVIMSLKIFTHGLVVGMEMNKIP